MQAWRTGEYLYIDAPDRELYDQSTDPKAERNLASNSKAVVDTAERQITEFYQKTKSSTAGEKTKLSLEQTENLHALGYMIVPILELPET